MYEEAGGGVTGAIAVRYGEEWLLRSEPAEAVAVA